MRILPAPSGTGIVFRRTDLDGFEIEAVSRNVARVSYATSLMKKGVLISTTEHVLSAFIGLGIDNAIVELDNLELPILDGSAQPFVDMIRKVGIRKQRRARKYLKIRRDLEMREGNKFIGVYPADSYSVSYHINFPHPLIGKETFQVELTNGSYLKHIAAARTFGSREDEQAMRNMGLIRGASRENCIVLTRYGIENGPLRFSDEFVRCCHLADSFQELGVPSHGTNRSVSDYVMVTSQDAERERSWPALAPGYGADALRRRSSRRRACRRPRCPTAARRTTRWWRRP